jgi:hypothetical protein
MVWCASLKGPGGIKGFSLARRVDHVEMKGGLKGDEMAMAHPPAGGS